MVGRSHELRELESGLDEAAAGSGGLFLLVGEPGIGKTRLADEVTRGAQGRGFTVHWGRCWEVGGAPAFWPWIQIFRSMLRDPRSKAATNAYGDVLSRIVPELRTGERGVPELDQAQARFQLFDEIWALLRAVAEQAPIALVLDDLHAADPSSLALLQFVSRDLRTHPAFVIATYRDREAKPSTEVSEAIRDVARNGTFLPLRRLSVEDVGALVQERSGKAARPELVAQLHAATEGNPMFVDQVYRMLDARGMLDAAPAALPIPEGMREMIKSRLGTLDPSTRSVLEAAAVVGREFTRPLLASVTERDEPSLRTPLDSAIEAGVVSEVTVGEYEFAHALFREALYRDLPVADRAKLHALVAAALEATNAPERGLGEIAQHLLSAHSVVGAERAIEGSLRAAERALGALAFEDAATILSDALGTVGGGLRDERLRCRALTLLVEARTRLGQHDAARKACDEAAAIARRLGDATLLAEAGLALGVELMAGIILAPLVALLEEARNTLPPAPTPLRAKVLARLAAALQPSPNPDEPVALAREAVSMARTLGDFGTLRACLHLGGSALVDFADPVERCVWDAELLHLSTEAGDSIAALRAHTRLFFDHLELGETEQADRQVEAHAELADTLGLPAYQWLTLMMRSLRALWDGRFDESEELSERAQRVGQKIMTLEMELSSIMQSWGRALARGEPLPKLDRVMTVTARFPNSSFMGIVVRAFEYARQGDVDAARGVLEQVAPESPFLVCFGPHLRYMTETCARLGDKARAEPVYRTMLKLQDRMGSWGRVGMVVEGPCTWLLGILAGTLDRFDDATRHFENALSRCTRSGMKPYEAITCLEYARMLSRRGPEHETKRAELVRRGIAIADALGMGGIRRQLDELDRSTSEPTTAKSATLPSARPEPAELAPMEFSMKKEGDVWAVAASGRVLRIKDSRGMQMLAELALHPNREFHVLTLAGSDLVDAGDAGEVIDRRAAQAYRDRLDDLKDQLEEAESWGDRARAELARNERDRIAQELARGTGLGGRSRRAGAAAERARINVQRRVREAIRRIGEQDAKLGRYLDRAVRTGTFCAFEP